MGRWAVAAFARRFREAIERDGIAALERFDWAGGFSELGFEMDCGRSSEGRTGLESATPGESAGWRAWTMSSCWEMPCSHSAATSCIGDAAAGRAHAIGS